MIIKLADGKYTYILEDNGQQKVFRYGEVWKDLTGDKFTYCLATRCHIFEAENAALREQLAEVGALYNSMSISFFEQQKQLAAAQKGAERYRWHVKLYSERLGVLEEDVIAELDAAIEKEKAE